MTKLAEVSTRERQLEQYASLVMSAARAISSPDPRYWEWVKDDLLYGQFPNGASEITWAVQFLPDAFTDVRVRKLYDMAAEKAKAMTKRRWVGAPWVIANRPFYDMAYFDSALRWDMAGQNYQMSEPNTEFWVTKNQELARLNSSLGISPIDRKSKVDVCVVSAQALGLYPI